MTEIQKEILIEFLKESVNQKRYMTIEEKERLKNHIDDRKNMADLFEELYKIMCNGKSNNL